MPEIKEKHPSWFKMKIERRELVRQLSPKTAVNVLLACWDFLETGEKPTGLSPIENVAFSSFMPDMDEAWKRYLQRVTAKKPKGAQSGGIDRYHAISTETEEETEPEIETDTKKVSPPLSPKRGKRGRFVPPSVEEVTEYCQERQNSIDPEEFISFYASKGWVVGKSPMRSWKHAMITWEKSESGKRRARKKPQIL